jgi:formylmethanofuran dehydrogenase subunit E
MQSLNELLKECEVLLHGHICAGQLLGARMAIRGCQMIGINDPRHTDRKKTHRMVEIDRCMGRCGQRCYGSAPGKAQLKVGWQYPEYFAISKEYLKSIPVIQWPDLWFTGIGC